MREIKYRGWDTIQKKMYSGKDLWGENILLSLDGKGFVQLISSANYKYGDWVFRESIIPLKFTGLKDKYGKEIYEGDVVKSFINDEFSEIKFGEWNYGDGLEECSWGIGFYWDDDMSPFGIDINCTRKKYEIIGNIYENPELTNERAGDDEEI